MAPYWFVITKLLLFKLCKVFAIKTDLNCEWVLFERATLKVGKFIWLIEKWRPFLKATWPLWNAILVRGEKGVWITKTTLVHHSLCQQGSPSMPQKQLVGQYLFNCSKPTRYEWWPVTPLCGFVLWSRYYGW